MGEMIANIAHQWKQPLSAISMSVISFKTKLALESFNFDKKEDVQTCKKELEEKFDDISSYVLSLSQTMESFKNFFKPEKEREIFNLSQSINKSLQLLHANFQNKNIEIISDIDEIELKGFENAFSQVIINILNNARDALIENKSNSRRLIFITVKEQNRFITIAIKDNAGGVNEEIIERIFEPYFTTKHQSNGTGIGLYMTQEILHKHMNGEVSVKNLAYTYEGCDYRGAEFLVRVNSKNYRTLMMRV